MSVNNRLAGFDLIQAPYKTVGDHEIRADFIIPKSDYAGKRPVIVRFHGGGLVCQHIPPLTPTPSQLTHTC